MASVGHDEDCDNEVHHCSVLLVLAGSKHVRLRDQRGKSLAGGACYSSCRASLVISASARWGSLALLLELSSRTGATTLPQQPQQSVS